MISEEKEELEEDVSSAPKKICAIRPSAWNLEERKPLIQDRKDDSGGSSGEEPKKIPYPKSVFFILSTEACERFSYYGMRTILSLYLRSLFMKQSYDEDRAENVATIIYHAFIFLSYFTSIFGAWLADSFLGKFKTIFYISIFYAVGQAVLAFGAIPDSPAGIQGMPQGAFSFLGLFLIAFGTGGIKPCVVAFGADQFKLPEQKEEMTTFFGVFYACINLGSMLSTILTPLFREKHCYGEESCYSLAFGVPAILMVVAILFFAFGRPSYNVAVPNRNVVADFFRCTWTGLVGKFTSKSKADHWLDHSEPLFGSSFVSDVKAVYRVSVLFLMYPVFWALYDQQGSRWTFQATRMDGRVFGFLILPDQMQVINAVLILLFIPLFDRMIYPFLDHRNIMRTPLQRIITGGVLLALSFIISAFVEMNLEPTYPVLPKANETNLLVHGGIDCSHLVWSLGGMQGNGSAVFVPSGVRALAVGVDGEEDIDIKALNLTGATSQTVFITRDVDATPVGFVSEHPDRLRKSESGMPYIRFIYNTPHYEGWVIDLMKNNEPLVSRKLEKTIGDTNATVAGEQGRMTICLTGKESQLCELDNEKKPVEHELLVGGSYNIFIEIAQTVDGQPSLHVDIIALTAPNAIHMLWLLPQYIVLTAGEILFSITSLTFAFTQAPESMKAVLQCLYLLTTAGGDLIDLFVIAMFADAFSSQTQEFLLFAGLMLLDMFILALLARRYDYVDYTKKDDLEMASPSKEDPKFIPKSK